MVNPPLHCIRDNVTQCHSFGAPLFWEGGCVPYSVHETGSAKLGLGYSEAQALVAHAFGVWPTASCAYGVPSVAFVEFGATSCGRAEFNHEGPNANAVIFRDFAWSHEPSQIGVTTVSFDTESGRILGADVEINTFGHQLTLAQAQFVLMHEAGHFLGLDHSADPMAVMNSRYDFSSDPVLADDDIAGICAAYPSASENHVCEREPHGGYAEDCGGDVEGSCATQAGRAAPDRAFAIVLMLVVSCIARRRSIVAKVLSKFSHVVRM